MKIKFDRVSYYSYLEKKYRFGEDLGVKVVSFFEILY